MVTAKEKRARELFEQRYKPKEVSEIPLGKGTKISDSTIKGYYTAWRKGYENNSEYRKDLARIKESENRSEHRDYLSREEGFKSYSEYRKYLRDPYFREIWDSDGLDEVGRDNHYVLMLRFSEMKDKLESEAKGVGEIEGTEEYEKLEEILPKKGNERIKYIGKLKRGVEILNYQGKV